MRLAAFLMLGPALLVAAPARAACPTQPPDRTVCPSGCDHPTVSAAVAAAADGDAICVDPGTYVGAFTVDGIDLSIESSDLATFTGLTGGGGASELVRIQNGGSLTLVGISAGSVSNKRCFFVTGSGSSLTLDRATVRDCTQSADGAAVYLDGGASLYATGSLFTSNGGGGASGAHVFANAASRVDAYDTDFIDGHSDNAGAVRLLNTPGTFELADFGGNLADNGSGGAIWAEGADLTVASCSFYDNFADNGHGGAVYTVGATTLTITDSWFELNRADGSGGAVRSSANGAEALVVTRTTFLDNRADHNGASGGDGGGIFSDSPDTVTLTECAFDGNYAFDGGGVFVTGGRVDIVRSAFCGNDADNDGGGLYFTSLLAGSDILSTLFQGNSCDSEGGGVYGNSTVNVRNNDFLDNDCAGGGNDGDGWYNAGGTATLRNNVFAYHPNQGFRRNGGATNLDYNLWFSNGTDISSASKGAGAVNASPEFTSWTANGVCDDDLTLQAASPAIDAGDPAVLDLDGSRSDIGIHGGPDAPIRDNDSDGFGVPADCNDGDPSINPNATELLADGVDQDCDGEELCYQDLDGDGFGTATIVSSTFLDCDGPGVSAFSNDCNDGSATSYPGAPPIVGDGLDNDCIAGEECWVDADNDGFGGAASMDDLDLDCTDDPGQSDVGGDCNDASAIAYPGGPEITGDEIDGNCDGQELCYQDGDGDGFGAAATLISTDLDCDDLNESGTSNDCNDSNATIYPGALETVADGVDQDCSGGDSCFSDVDGDNYGSTSIIASADLDCADLGEAAVSTDCDNSNPNIHPGAVELPVDGIDQNCDGGDVCYADKDSDGHAGNLLPYRISADLDCTDPDEFAAVTDCDDNDPNRFPGALEVPSDGVDNDCDGFERCYQDGDGDGRGGPFVDSGDLDCNDPGESPVGGDCDDTDPNIFPGANEVVANGVDEDCDGNETCYDDQDFDGFGNPLVTEESGTLSCIASGVSPNDLDCNDGAATTYPGAAEIVADEVDQDCDGRELCFADSDGDTYGVSNPPYSGNADTDCDDPGESVRATDCDDTDAAVNPSAIEIANDGQDRNCDGFELCPLDQDNDGFGRANTGLTPALSCVAVGFANNASDCDDDVDTAYPGAPEIPDDTIDQDCDGNDTRTCYRDADQDGYGSTTVVLAGDGVCDLSQLESRFATDCDDANATVRPGATEIKSDGIDQDCDGQDLVDCYLDADDDGYGAVPAVIVPFQGDCGPEPGMADSADDCDDGDDTVYPGAPDVCGDGLDSDCNGEFDDDGDGLTWDEEVALGLDDCVADVDGDTLLDGFEVREGIDPTHPDTDGDTVPDGEDGPPPNDNDLDGLIDALDPDDDGDTVPTADEENVAGGDNDNDGLLNRLDPDDDNDTLVAWAEDVDRDGTPLNDDTDLDGIHNWLDPDDDNDGLPTSDEVTWGADHLSIDTDGDSIVDAIEWGGGAAPRDSELCPPTFSAPCPDGIPDILDDDDDNDGIPSAIEGDGDLDVDSVPNYLDPDSDGDGTFDVDEYSGGSFFEDSDGDGAPNFLDDDDTDGATGDPDRDTLSTGEENQLGSLAFDPDTDGDGVPDGVEVGGFPATPRDTDRDTTPDVFDLDDDGDGRPTLAETGLLCSDGLPSFDIEFDALGLSWVCPDGVELVPDYIDTDGDGLFDYLDPDDDGDGALSLDEGAGDVDGDGIPNWLDPLDRDGPVGDADGDLLLNEEELALGTDPYDPDTDGDGLLDSDELDGGPGSWIERDSDGDGQHDALDPDDDGDGVPTAEESTVDTDGDGTLDYLDLDSDGDGKPDADEAGLDADCDLRPDRVDADDTGPCEDSGQRPQGSYRRQGCACESSMSTGAGWLAVAALALALRRRRAA